MLPDEKIRLRPLLLMTTEIEGKRFILAQDQTRRSQPVLLPMEMEPILRLLGGGCSMRDIQLYLTRASGGSLAPLDEIAEIVDELDASLLLDSPRFHETQYLEKRFWDQSRLRKPFHAGQAYPNDPQELKETLDAFFEDAAKHGKNADKPKTHGAIRGILAPHIDLKSGGGVFASAYDALKSAKDAELFVILGTAHDYTQGPISVSRKDYMTPLGILETDNDFIDRLLGSYSPNWIADDFSHRNEHSVEFQTVFLKHMLGDDPSKKIAPILVGDFSDSIEKKTGPSKDAEISGFIEAFRKTVSEYGRKTVYIASGDLAHIGPRYGSPDPVSPDDLADCERKDMEMLDAAGKGAEDLFEFIAEERDSRNVCGFPPLYLMLKMIGECEGETIRRAHWFDDTTLSAVTFAAAVFK